MNMAWLERSVATAMQVYQGSGKSLGEHLVLDLGMPTIGRVVLWMWFGMGCKVVLGTWNEVDMCKRTFENVLLSGSGSWEGY